MLKSYVDDGLKSVPTEKEALHLVNSSKALSSQVGLSVHKFVSISSAVMQGMDAKEISSGVRDLSLHDHLYEKVLRIGWNFKAGTFHFKITMRFKMDTRRRILSQVSLSSVFNPLRLVAPLLVGGKQILQKFCSHELDWDTEIPEDLQLPWETWKSQLETLENLKLQDA